ncbi:MAG TPA: hypothetical protein VIJ47_14530 [Acidimicrobiales bacterium]
MAPFTIITEDAITRVDALVEGATVRIAVDALGSATGWTVKPEGLCRGAVCIPRALWPEVLGDALIDLADLARMTGQVLALDTDEGLAVLSPGAEERATAMGTLHAPAFTVNTIDDEAVSLADFRGRKKLLVAFASW